MSRSITLTELGQAKGQESETRLLRIINRNAPTLRRLGFIQRIDYPTTEQDHQGIDLLFVTNLGVSLPVQVKSSRAQIRKHRRNHNEIPSILITPEQDDSKIFEELVKILLDQHQKLLRAIKLQKK